MVVVKSDRAGIMLASLALCVSLKLPLLTFSAVPVTLPFSVTSVWSGRSFASSSKFEGGAPPPSIRCW